MSGKTKTLLPIPLPDNTKTGWSCGEVAVISTFDYFNVRPLLNEERAMILTHKIPKYNTWPEQLVRIASECSMINVTIHRSIPLTFPVSDYIRTHYTNISSECLIRETDIDDLEKAIQEYKNNGKYIIKKISLEDVLAEVISGRVVIVWCCFDTLYGNNTEKGFNAHYIVVTGFDSDYIYIHECGGVHKQPEANKPITHKQFMKALGPDPNFMVWSLIK